MILAIITWRFMTLVTLTGSLAFLPQTSSQILTSAVKVAALKKRPFGAITAAWFTSWFVFTFSTPFPVPAGGNPILYFRV